MKTVLQEIIQWTIENAFNVEAQDGTTYIAIDYEEMRTKFDEWLEKDKKQIIENGKLPIPFVSNWACKLVRIGWADAIENLEGWHTEKKH